MRFRDVIVEGSAGGSLVLSVADRKSPARTTQPIEVLSDGFIVFLVRADDQRGIQVFIGNTELRDLAETSAAQVVLPTPPPSQPMSLEHPDAEKLCARWIAHRATHYRPPKAKPGRRVRTPAEDIQKLAESEEIIRSAAQAARNGELAHLNTVMTQLRALVVEKIGNPNLNPLLFRVAAHHSLSLPVYAHPAGHPPEVVAMSVGDGPRLHCWFQRDEVVDLQDWMTRPFAKFEGLDLDGTDFLYRASSSETAHVDPSRWAWIDRLEEVQIGDETLLATRMLELGDTVAALCGWVRNRAQS